MRIVAWRVLAEFAEQHPETLASLQRWRAIVRSARWRSMDDVRQNAPNGKVLNAERVRFEVAGGSYRLIVAIDFDREAVFIKFVGSHAAYDRIDALTVSLF